MRNIYRRHSLKSIFLISLKHKLPLLLPSTVWKQETGLTFRCSQLNKRKRNLAVTNKCDYIQFTITNIYKTRQDKTTLFYQGSPVSCKAGILRGHLVCIRCKPCFSPVILTGWQSVWQELSSIVSKITQDCLLTFPISTKPCTCWELFDSCSVYLCLCYCVTPTVMCLVSTINLLCGLVWFWPISIFWEHI